MLNITLLCVGKLKEAYWRDACAEYEKRLGAFCRFSLVEVVSSCPTNWGMTPQAALKWIDEKMLPYYPLGVYKDRSAAKEAEA